MRYIFRILLFTASLWVVGCQTPSDPLSETMFSDMMTLRDSHSLRISSWDRTGGNMDFRALKPGESMELANIAGAGCVRHIYFTILGGEHYLRDLVLRMYWDGETTPSVETPFGDFFGEGHERIRYFRSLMVTVNEGIQSPMGTAGFNSYFPMPFSDGAIMTLTNDGEDDVPAIWYHIEYETLDEVPRDKGRFHAQWHRENPTTPIGPNPGHTIHNGINRDGKENYVILDAKGHGNLAGYFLNIDCDKPGWYGEGDDMIFIDGEEWPPSFHGTGSEEIFGGGACPNVEYDGPYTGFHLIANPNFQGKVSMYRFYVNDPIRFQKDIRVTIEHGHANNMANDYSSTAFWYQAEPHVPFPALLPASERHPREGTDIHDRAYVGYEKARQAAFALRPMIMRGELPPDPELYVTLWQRLLPECLKAINAKDYPEAVRLSDEVRKLIDDYLAGHGKH